MFLFQKNNWKEKKQIIKTEIKTKKQTNNNKTNKSSNNEINLLFALKVEMLSENCSK